METALLTTTETVRRKPILTTTETDSNHDGNPTMETVRRKLIDFSTILTARRWNKLLVR